ncbi:hypothetical protein [Rathayibacter festucae]|uniref:tetratricopeptide repeat protein n=1 Tax=Rathayibacter festucae TaxID=110937 RepID=UPI002A6A5CEB|nr:hypothetical protein [Rathayibacter festucae]MDY0913668.1 hypothetical protein [Rathayibacter festucae]
MSEIIPVAKTAGPFLKRIFDRAILPNRIAKLVNEYAQTAGHELNSNVLARAIRRSKLIALLSHPDKPELVAAIERAAFYSETSTKPIPRDALIEWITTACIALISRDQSQAIAYRAIERKVTHSASEITESIDRSMDYRATFDHTKKSFPPALQTAAEKIAESNWPGIYRLVHSFRVVEDRARTVEEWDSTLPPFMRDAPAEALALIGLIAAQYGCVIAARNFLDRALAEGVSRRAAIVMHRMLVTTEIDQDTFDALISSISHHPLAALIKADVTQQFTDYQTILEDWSPAVDERDLYLLLATTSALRDDRLLDAIQFGEQGWVDFSSTACAELAIAAHVELWKERRDAPRFQQLDRALSLALEVRTHKRALALPSGPIAAQISEIYILRGNREAAIQAVKHEEGEATAEEANHEQARFMLARLLIWRATQGDLPQLLEGFDENSNNRLYILAALAESKGQNDSAIAIWRQIIAKDLPAGDTLQAGFRLALLGELAPELANLDARYNSDVADIEIVANLFREATGALELARTRARQSTSVMYSLFQYYDKRNMQDEILSFSQTAAKSFSDPDIWLSAASINTARGDTISAIQAVKDALETGGEAWDGRSDAYRRLVEIYAGADRWVEAAEAAEALVALQPHDAEAVWAVIASRDSAGDAAGALKFWRAHGALVPHTARAAASWLLLVRRAGSSVGSARDVEDVVQRFRTDYTVRRLHVGLLLEGVGDDPSGRKLSFADFQSDFPDQEVFWAFTTEPDATGESLLSQLVEWQKEHGPQPDYSELDTALQSGQVPLGLAAAIRRNFYTSALVDNRSGLRYMQRSSAVDSMGLDVVVDLSALRSLALLDNTVANVLLGMFTSLHGTAEQRLDSSRSRDELFAAERGVGAILELFDSIQMHSHPNLSPQLEDLGSPDKISTIWLSSADYALEAELTLWVDDLAYGKLAEHYGLRTISTADLLSKSLSDARLSKVQVAAASKTLLQHGYVGIDFNVDVFRDLVEAGEIDVAPALRNVPRQQVREAFLFGVEILGKKFDALREVGSWVAAVAALLHQTDPENQVDLVGGWVGFVMARSEIAGHNLSSVLLGTKELMGDDWPAVLQKSADLLMTEYSERFGTELAAQIVRTTAREMAEEDRRVIFEAIWVGDWSRSS